ncbi:MAG: hypothetical protein ACR2NP_01355 [Pirellulaceae bacterium]
MNSVRYPRARLTLTSLVSCLSLVVATQVATATPPLQQGDPPERPEEIIATGQQSFEIPFSVNAAQSGIVEVLLHQSNDRGQTWQEHSRRSPEAGAFKFASSQDGEFWFAIQTVDRDGRKLPSAQRFQPELRIAIDTQRPTFEFQIRPDSAGRIVGTWQASDPNIDPCSLEIEYRAETAGDDKWITVPTQCGRVPPAGVYRDELAWWPRISARNLVVRARIQDRAGNSAEVQRQIMVPLVAGTRPASAQTVTSQPVPVSPATQNNQARANTPATTTQYQQSRLPAALAHLYGTTSGTQRQGSAASQANAGAASPNPQTTPQPPRSPNRLAQSPTGSAQAIPPATRSPDATQWRSRNDGSPRNVGVTENSTNNWQPGTDGTRVAAQPQSVLVTPQSIQQSQTPAPNEPPRTGHAQWISSTTGQSQSPPPVPSTILASGPKMESLRQMARHSNSRRFQLEYDIDAIGPEGVKTVELWMTSDGGNSWRRWTTDDDRRSPVNVEVEAEGIYGYRILVVSNEGLRARQPRRGDPADMWVNVDTTRPQAQITAVPYGRGEDAGRLLVQWQASDANLVLRPVRLQFSPVASGPWTTIENGIRNTGQYAWKPAADVPDRVYLRLEVRDAAGNLQVHQLNRPIDVSGLLPRGHIRGLKPIGGEPAAGRGP